MGNIVKIIIMVGKIIFVFIISSCTAQLKFGGSAGSSGNTNTGTKQPETDTRFFTGNQALDGGIVGLGAGLLGGAVLSGALSGGSNGCGRRRRQAEGTNTKFLGALLGGSSSGCNCGRRRRQAPGEDQPVRGLMRVAESGATPQGGEDAVMLGSQTDILIILGHTRLVLSLERSRCKQILHQNNRVMCLMFRIHT